MSVGTAPAFPQHDYINEDKGLSIRAYFAAHAPAEPQAWFKPKTAPMPTVPADKPSFPEDFPERAEDRNYIINLAWSWRRDPCYDLADYVIQPADTASRQHSNALLAHAHPFLVDYEKAWNDFWKAQRDWEIEEAKQRLIQWPWAWADAVLAAGGAQ